jgi:hypothetical protein
MHIEPYPFCTLTKPVMIATNVDFTSDDMCIKSTRMRSLCQQISDLHGTPDTNNSSFSVEVCSLIASDDESDTILQYLVALQK